jgi:hypothetical protein
VMRRDNSVIQFDRHSVLSEDGERRRAIASASPASR